MQELHSMHHCCCYLLLLLKRRGQASKSPTFRISAHFRREGNCYGVLLGDAQSYDNTQHYTYTSRLIESFTDGVDTA